MKKQIMKIGVNDKLLFNISTVISVAMFKLYSALSGFQLEVSILSDEEELDSNWDPNSTDPFKGILIDIGDGEYDFSDVEYEEYPDDNYNWYGEWVNAVTNYYDHPYSTAALLWEGYAIENTFWWKEFFGLLLEKLNLTNNDENRVNLINEVQKRLFIGVSAAEYDDFSHESIVKDLAAMVADFEPAPWENKSDQEAFEEAVNFAVGIFERILKQAGARIAAESVVYDVFANAKNGIAIFDKGLPWKGLVLSGKVGDNVNYAIYPSIRGGYICETLPNPGDRFSQKKPFPVEWRGLRDDNLTKVCGIEDATFCHAAGFLAVSKTLEGAMALAEKSLAEFKKVAEED